MCAYSIASLDQGLSGVVPAAVATTQAKPHAQQQLARELEVARAAMGKRRRPHSFGEVQQGNSQPCRWVGILLCTAAVQQQIRVRAYDLILVIRMRQQCRAAVRQFQRATRKVWCTHARASVCTLLVYAPGLVLCSSTLCVSQAANPIWLAVFVQKARGGRAYFFICLECCGMNSFLLVAFVKKKKKSYRPQTFFWHFLRLKQIHSRP